MPLATLLKALGRDRTISEFIVTQTDQQAVYRGAHGNSFVASKTVRAVVFVDSRAGRGQAAFEIGDQRKREIRDAISTAAARASAHQGPAWRLRPAAAPARVDVRSAAVDGVEAQVAQTLLERANALDERSQAAVWAKTIETRVVASTGFDNRYRGTTVGVDMRLGASGARESVTLLGRRPQDLDLKTTVTGAQRRAGRETERTPPGRYRLVVQASGYGDDPSHSIFAPLVQLSDPESYRLGIGRSRLGQTVTGPGFSLLSDGTRDFAVRSQPFDDSGAATRQWTVIDHGTLAGLSLSSRSAALVDREPNGGIGNLVINARRQSMADLLSAQSESILVVDRSSWIDFDPSTGALALGLARGRVIDQSGQVTAVRGGVISADSSLFAAPVGSLEDITTPWLAGPAALRLGAVHLA